MKKIGILTFHRSFNYGAFMQAYALSRRVKQDTGATVELINYTSPKVETYYHRSLWGNLRQPINVWKMHQRNQAFRRSWPSLPLSGPPIITDNYTEFLATIAGTYDAVIVGSDAVWNWNLRGFPNAYFLHGDLQCPKFSYAASGHGQDFSAATLEQRVYIRETLLTFDFLGVRDEVTAAFVQELDPRLTAHRTCDPSLFLDLVPEPEAMRRRLATTYRMKFDRPLLGLMSGSKELGKRLRAQYGDAYQIVALYEPNPYADYYLYDLTPFEWAQVFSLFAVTFTQFFHGALMSLKNGTPVIAIDYWPYSARYVGKMQDVLTWLGLEGSFFLASHLDATGWQPMWNQAARHLADRPTAQIAQAITRVTQSYLPFMQQLKSRLGLLTDTTASAQESR